MAQSLLLSYPAWDLVLNNAGNIALAGDVYPSDPLKAEAYARAQDAACAIRLFQGENWYATTQGVPYFQLILGKTPNLQVMKAAFVQAALTVDGIASAQCFISSIKDRAVTGQVQIVTTAGQAAASNF